MHQRRKLKFVFIISILLTSQTFGAQQVGVKQKLSEKNTATQLLIATVTIHRLSADIQGLIFAFAGNSFLAQFLENHYHNNPRVLTGYHFVHGLQWSPTGNQIAVIDANDILIIDPETDTTLLTLTHPRSSGFNENTYLSAIVWSPDGMKLAAGNYSNVISIWDTEEGVLIHDLQPSNRITLTSQSAPWFSWSPDGKKIVTAEYPTRIIIWNAEIGKHEYSTLTSICTPNAKHSTSWSPDGTKIVLAITDDLTEKTFVSILIVLDLRKLTLKPIDGQLKAIAWSPDSRYLTIGTDKAVVTYHDIANLSKKYYHGTYNSGCTPYSVQWSSDSTQLLKSIFDRTNMNLMARIWNPSTNESLYELRGPIDAEDRLLADQTIWKLRAASWSPNNIHVASTSNNSFILIWQLHPSSNMLRLTFKQMLLLDKIIMQGNNAKLTDEEKKIYRDPQLKNWTKIFAQQLLQLHAYATATTSLEKLFAWANLKAASLWSN